MDMSSCGVIFEIPCPCVSFCPVSNLDLVVRAAIGPNYTVMVTGKVYGRSIQMLALCCSINVAIAYGTAPCGADDKTSSGSVVLPEVCLYAPVSCRHCWINVPIAIVLAIMCTSRTLVESGFHDMECAARPVHGIIVFRFQFALIFVATVTFFFFFLIATADATRIAPVAWRAVLVATATVAYYHACYFDSVILPETI